MMNRIHETRARPSPAASGRLWGGHPCRWLPFAALLAVWFGGAAGELVAQVCRDAERCAVEAMP